MTAERNGKSPEVPNESSRKMAGKDSPWHIDKEMLRFKIHFFLFIGAQGAAVPYIVVFATERLGLAASSVGVVLTIQMILFIFFKPLTGYIADYFNRLKVILCILAVLNVSGYLLLMTIPKHEQNELPATMPVSENNLGVSDLCLMSFAKLHSPADLTFTETVAQNATCDVCLISYNCVLSVMEQYNLANEALKNVSLRKKSSAKYEKILVLLFKRDCNVHLILCNGEYKSPLQNCSMNLIETSFLYDVDRNCQVEGNQRCQKFLCQDSEYIANSNQEQNWTESANDNPDIKSSSNSRIINDFRTVQFWLFAFMFSLASVTANATFTLSDTACCESIQKSGAEFGRQRLWGAIGWGAIAPLAGYLNDNTHGFLASWILLAIMMLLFLWNLFKLDLVKPHFSQNILRDVGTVLRSKEFLCFELVILINGFALGMIWFYLVLFLTSIGGSELLCGLALTVQSFGGSIPFMFYSDRIIRKIGHFNVLKVSLFINVIRFLWYSYLQNPWWVLPVEVAHGITYGLYYTALASYGKLSAKPGTEATTQAVLFSTNEGIGGGLGCIFAGIAFDHFGGHKTFFITGILCGCGFIISLILSYFVIGKQNKTILIAQPQVDDPSNNSNITQLQVDDPLNNSNITQLQVVGSLNNATQIVKTHVDDPSDNSFQINQLQLDGSLNDLNISTERLVEDGLNNSNLTNQLKINGSSYNSARMIQEQINDSFDNSA